MFTLQYAKNPVYFDETGNAINLIVKFEEFNNEMPFLATNYDTELHGVDLYNRAVAGEFGEVALYVAPAEPVQPQSTGTQTA